MAHLKSDTEWTSPYIEKILFLQILAWRSNNMQIPSSLVINVSENLAVRISIWYVIGKNPKNFWQSLTIMADPVLNNFILFTSLLTMNI